MALPNAYTQYNNSKILTASPAELTLMLYEGAIKFCNIAEQAVEEKDIQKAHNNIRKVQNIIGYLQSTLDTRYPVAQDFINIYDYLSKRLVEANVKRIKRSWRRSICIFILCGTTGRKSCVSIARKGLTDGKPADDIV